jgi:hypothetical protein
MVMMPMGEQDSADAGFLVSQDLTKSLGPYGLAFAGVNEDSFGTCSDQICICALQCELARISTGNSDDR